VKKGQEAEEPTMGRSIAWFSGADLGILARCRSEQNFYRRLGAAVLLLSCLSGMALSFSLGYVLHTDPLDLWWAGVGWAAFMACGIEPLVLQLSPTRNWLALGLAVLWRLVLSLLLALQLSEPLILAINTPEINKQLHTERGEAEKQVIAQVRSTFGPKVEEDREELREIRARVADLQHRGAKYRYLATKEGEGGCGPACLHYQELAQQTSQRLAAVSKRNSHRQVELHRQIDDWRNRLRSKENEGKEAVHEGDGLWARIGAMGAISGQGIGREAEVWALRLLFLVIDLLPLTAKLFRLATVDSPYERRLAAARLRDALPAKEEEAAAAVRESEIKEQARADKEVGRARINLDTDQRISDMEMGSSAHSARPRNDRGGLISAWNLGEYVEEMETHESQPVPVPPELARVGFVGAGLLGGLLILAALSSALTGHTFAGTWMLAVAFAAAAALSVYTHGFRRAPAWGLRAILATFLVGLILPLILIAMNI